MSENAPQKSNTTLYVIIGCALMFLALPFIGVLAAIVIPALVTQQYEAKQDEIYMNMKEIKISEEIHKVKTGMYVEAIAYPDPPGKEPQPWIPSESGEFKRLEWEPAGETRGSYSVTTTSNLDFKIVGISDLDGDGVYATYIATKSTNPYVITPPGVY